jgi:hypothetical protein
MNIRDDDTVTRADDFQVSGTHYRDMGIQPWEVMEAVLSHEEFVGYLKGNVIKYSMRQGKKQDSDDANKAHHYRMKLTEIIEKVEAIKCSTR